MTLLRAALLACLMALARAGSAHAVLSSSDIATVQLDPPAGARLPPDLSFRDESGATVTAAHALSGHPAVLVFADYECKQLCGTGLGLAAGALTETGLEPGRDYVFLAIGLRTNADASNGAAAMRHAQLGGEDRAKLATATTLLSGDAAVVRTATASMGYTDRYDTGTNIFAHPVGLMVLTADGRLSRVLSGLSPDPGSLRLALAEASQGRIGGLADRVRLLCYGFDRVHGVYTPAIAKLLAASAAATVLGLGVGLFALRRREANG